jgi:hypothetical protein
MRNNDGPEDLVSRTRRFAVQVVRFYVALPEANVFFVLGRQLLRAGTSVGAITGRLAGQSPKPTSSARSRGPCRSWTKLPIGSSCCRKLA